jgi:hypothetical protein
MHHCISNSQFKNINGINMTMKAIQFIVWATLNVTTLILGFSLNLKINIKANLL